MNAEKLNKFIMLIKAAFFWLKKIIYITATALIINIIVIFEILWQFKITVFYYNIQYNIINSCEAKLKFQNHYSSFQCYMILQKSI